VTEAQKPSRAKLEKRTVKRRKERNKGKKMAPSDLDWLEEFRVFNFTIAGLKIIKKDITTF
jgi:hypothetical protein